MENSEELFFFEMAMPFLESGIIVQKKVKKREGNFFEFTYLPVIL